jgi:hypothetical protein
MRFICDCAARERPNGGQAPSFRPASLLDPAGNRRDDRSGRRLPKPAPDRSASASTEGFSRQPAPRSPRTANQEQQTNQSKFRATGQDMPQIGTRHSKGSDPRSQTGARIDLPAAPSLGARRALPTNISTTSSNHMRAPLAGGQPAPRRADDRAFARGHAHLRRSAAARVPVDRAPALDAPCQAGPPRRRTKDQIPCLTTRCLSMPPTRRRRAL